ncbi:MAG: hypothetical protein PVI86_01115 [Phycisphaerae bacterium]
MEDAKDAAKATKKAAKAATKAAKAKVKEERERALRELAARQKLEGGVTPQERAVAAAERSAAAAERQAHLQRYRVLYAALMVIIGLATLLITLKPWQYIGSAPPAPETTTPTDPGAAGSGEDP